MSSRSKSSAAWNGEGVWETNPPSQRSSTAATVERTLAKDRGASVEGTVPKLSEFFGISIYVYWGDHGPPHFHARYAGQKAMIAIEDLSVLAGKLSPRALGLVMEWAALHQDELREVWRRAMNNEPLGTIEPLS